MRREGFSKKRGGWEWRLQDDGGQTPSPGLGRCCGQHPGDQDMGAMEDTTRSPTEATGMHPEEPEILQDQKLTASHNLINKNLHSNSIQQRHIC